MEPDVVSCPSSSSGDAMCTSAKVDTLLACCLCDESLRELAYIPRFKHRLAIVQAWSMPAGARVLDIGCGQGESTLALALELGPDARITGIDSARSDYGSPITIGEGQAYALRSVLGPRLRFQRADAASLLLPPSSGDAAAGVGPAASGVGPGAFDAAALCHSLWYMGGRDVVFALFNTLAEARIPRVYLAEYAFGAGGLSLPEAQEPHVLAARAQALFHQWQPRREADPLAPNIRAAPEPATVLEAARAAGFDVVREGSILPAEDMLEGHFEARYTMGERFSKHVRDENLPREQEAQILAYVPRVARAMEQLEGRAGHVRTMDVWWAELELRKGETPK